MELAGAVVGALTEHTINVIENEISYASDCKQQLDHLIQTLKHINGLFHDKASLKLHAEHVKPAMVPLRQLIYEADDIITDCIVRDEYATLFSPYNFKFLRETGKKLKGINSRLGLQLETLDKFLKLKQNLEENSEEAHKKEIASQDFNPNVVIGLEEDIDKIRGWILDPNKFHRVAVWGMGGLGKTTLVQEIFNDARVSECFGARIWVSVSKSFDKLGILKSILKKLGGKIPEDGGDSSSHLLREVRNAVVNNKGCLVVMDDVWRIEDVVWWSDLLNTLEVKDQRSCVIVTTRDKEVAAVAVRGDESRTHEARKLDEAQSWLLFSQFARPEPEFEAEGRKIVAKCGGLPLSIKAIGSLLAAKTNLREWTDVLDCFHGNSSIGGNELVIENLRLSYNELDSHLKQCLLCFSAYPEDSDINADQIIHWWHAEGLLQKKDSVRSPLELGREYLTALINRCLVEVGRRRPYDGRVYSCKMHDMARDLIMTIAKEEGFCRFNEQGIPIWDEDSYWLCLNANLMKEKDSGSGRRVKGKNVEDSKKCLSFGENSKLRAVLLMPDQQINLNKNSGQLSSLRMLDLSNGSAYFLDVKRLENLFDWIGDLTRLACLNLSGFEALEELPSSIYKLRNLQLLVLSGCSSLKRLDKSIAKLKRLVVLHLENCPRIEHLPRDLEKLYKLQELIGFTVTIGGANDKQTCGLAELANLTELRVLRIVLKSANEADLSLITDKWTDILSGLKNLKTLGIDAKYFRNGLHIVDCLGPPATLQELYLQNYHGRNLPEWIKPSGLSKLQYLCIEDAENVAAWNHERADWAVLEGLRLKNLKNLKADWAELKKGMPALSYLEVIKCDNLDNLPKDEMKNGIWRSPRKRST